MPRFKTEDSGSLPAAFRPGEPDQELEWLVGLLAEINRSGSPVGRIRGAVRDRTGVRLFLVGLSSGSSGWFGLDEPEPEPWAPVDVFG